MTPTMAATTAATPSPPPGIRTPPTPRFGYADNWEPFSPRKSSRISQRTTTANRTPSPQNYRRKLDTTTTTEKSRTRVARQSTGAISPIATPQKKRVSSTPGMDILQSKQSRLTTESSAKAASSLGIDNSSHLNPATTSVSQRSGMLPTPAKTPKKAPVEANPAIQAIARNLFGSDEDAMPNPSQKRAKKYSGISMESFRAEEVEESIEIFTDSQERIPQKDESAENPFYGDHFPQLEDSPRRRSKRRQVLVPGEGPLMVEDALKREDGMIFVFRGKRIFRKFADVDSAEDGEGSHERSTRLTRSSIKPRRLFQTEQEKSALEDEEADTDVEEPNRDHVETSIVEEANVPVTPVKTMAKMPETPATPRFAPVSPPDTRRITRAGEKRRQEESPIKAPSRASPFDSWPRVKSRTSTGVPAKRQGDRLAAEQTKKARA